MTAAACRARFLWANTCMLPTATALKMLMAVLLTMGRGTVERMVESRGNRLVTVKMVVTTIKIYPPMIPPE